MQWLEWPVGDPMYSGYSTFRGYALYKCFFFLIQYCIHAISTSLRVDASLGEFQYNCERNSLQQNLCLPRRMVRSWWNTRTSNYYVLQETETVTLTEGLFDDKIHTEPNNIFVFSPCNEKRETGTS